MSKYDDFEKNNSDEEYVEKVINNYINDNSYSNGKKRQITNSLENNYIVIVLSFFVAIVGGFFGNFIYNVFSSVFIDKDLSVESSISQTTATLSTADAVAKVSDSVVDVETEISNNVGEAGSGLIYTDDGYIITNEHIIRDSKSLKVTLNNGTVYDASIIGSDKKNDIAVLKINEKGLKPVIFGDSSDIRKGEDIFVIGNPLGELGGSVTNGIVSAKNRELELEGFKMSLIQTNAEINSGNSGGGVFKLTGELVGMVIAKSTGEDLEGLGFVIPSNTVKSCVEKLLK